VTHTSQRRGHEGQSDMFPYIKYGRVNLSEFTKILRITSQHQTQKYSSVAQLAERLAVNQDVGGSSPPGRAKRYDAINHRKMGKGQVTTDRHENGVSCNPKLLNTPVMGCQCCEFHVRPGKGNCYIPGKAYGAANVQQVSFQEGRNSV
jgi:hypothetical protein